MSPKTDIPPDGAPGAGASGAGAPAEGAPRDDRTVEEAASWFARLQGGGATGEDWLAFERWLGASPAHSAAYARLERLWVELDDHAPALRQALASPAPVAGARRPARGAPAHLTRRRWIVGAGAVAAGAGGVLLFRAGTDARSGIAGATVYEAPPGQIRQVALEDGTRVRLNAGSRLAVRFDRDARRVVMADAEAAFDVAHDPQRPFLIQVGDREVKVVGTEFNLRRRDGKVVLTVRRGIVEVRPSGQVGAEPTRVLKGQQLIHVEASGRSVLTAVDPQEAFGWTAGQLIYRDQPLSEVAADLGRRFGRPIRVADPQTAATRFTGVLVIDDEADVLDRLQALAPVRASRAQDGTVVLRRKD